VADSRGKFAHFSPEKRARLTDQCRELRRQGHKMLDIAAQLGISPSSVSNYLRAIEPKARTPATISSLPVPPPPDQAYLRSVTLALLGSMERELREVNAEHCFAGDVADAREIGDQTWLKNARAVLDAAQSYLDRLHSVVDDELVEACDPDRRDDVSEIGYYRRRDHHARPWTSEDRATVMREDLPLREIARLLRRTEHSVRSMRWRLQDYSGETAK
jgi:DNA-binding CsgD family transcriptional regulator